MGEILYADIIIDISLDNLDKPYQYRIPSGYEERVTVGSAVMIPFGKGNRMVKGYVVGIGNTPKYDVDKIKDIGRVPDKNVSVTEQLLGLAFWMKKRYGCTTNEAIKTVMPVKNKIRAVEKKTVKLVMDRDKAKAVLSELSGKANAAARVRVLEALLASDDGTLDYGSSIKKLKVSRQTFNSLAKEGILVVESQTRYRNPNMYGNNKSLVHQLTAEQEQAVTVINNDFDEERYGTYLLKGVTGSGKTEVYMSVMEHVVNSGGQAILLIPEIALTYQNAGRFYDRFGDRVSVINSRMSAGERYDQYVRAKEGEIDIIIGPRSALFTPFNNLKMIIVDEEHEDSYKSENNPRYDAITVAEKRAKMSGAHLILGSATPSVETYYRTTNECEKSRRIKLLELNNRAAGRELPAVHVVDMREEFKQKNYSIVSGLLRDRIRERIDRKEQVILFINRRGYAGFISCRNCGEPVKCPHCDVSLTMHYSGRGNNEKKLVCHYCGFESEMIDKCPECGSDYIGSFGQGTQKIEEYIKKEFSDARVIRMDADTTTGKEGHAGVLDTFARHEADILVGTQMIIKGHDFPKVTLVGVLAADTSLNVGDYNASEKCFQTLVQAAGRAGRGQAKGEVIIQTYRPEHMAISCAAKQDYMEFYNREMMFRNVMGYPPASYMLSIMISSPEEETARFLIEDVAKNTVLLYKNDDSVSIVGPAPHTIVKVSDIYRYMLYVKHRDKDALINLREKISVYLAEKYKDKKYIFTADV